MFKDTKELQDFILWCRKGRIKTVQVGDIKVEFSDLAFIDEIAVVEPETTEEKDTSKTLVDTDQQTDEEDLLFWSSR